MYGLTLTKKIGMCLLSLVIMFGMCFAMPVFADEEAINIKEIRPPAGFDSGEVDVSEVVKSHFDFVGRVDYKFDERIVIGDRNFQIAGDAKVSSVSQGAYVGARLNDRGEIVLLERIQPPR